MKIDMSFLPDGKSGNWEISSFTVKPEELSEMISIFKTGRGVPAGTYKKLTRGGHVIMSNTPDEIRDFTPFLSNAKGVILINGLGMGCLVKALLEKEAVEEIIVIEKSLDVINLVAPYFNDKRLTIINDDAFTYQPPKNKKYDYIWHDIWDDICADNLPEMAKLHRKYAKRVTCFQDSWSKGECQRQKRLERSYYY